MAIVCPNRACGYWRPKEADSGICPSCEESTTDAAPLTRTERFRLDMADADLVEHFKGVNEKHRRMKRKRLLPPAA